MRKKSDKPTTVASQGGTALFARRVRRAKDRSFTTIHLPDQHKRPIERVGAVARVGCRPKVVRPRIARAVGMTPVEPPPPMPVGRASSEDWNLPGLRLDQYYTKPEVARQLYRIFRKHFDPRAFLMVEPSAGTGSFSLLLPPGSLAYDIAPMAPGIQKADFLKVNIEGDHPVAVVGNPPYGKNASLAVRFFNHAARRADVIAMIFPKSFRKASIMNRLDRSFHLLHEVDVPPDAFLSGSKTVTVPTVFQIWVRRPTPRRLRPVRTAHPDFEFTTAERADFVIQRVGAQAGRLHHDFIVSKSSHYFIKGDVETVMAKLDFATVARNTAGNPSLAKSEIVELYIAELRRRRRG